VAKIGSGGHLGEMALLAIEGVPDKRSATADSTEHSEVLEISYSSLEKLTKASPTFAAVFYKNLAMTLAGRIRRTTEDLAGLRALRLRHT